MEDLFKLLMKDDKYITQAMEEMYKSSDYFVNAMREIGELGDPQQLSEYMEKSKKRVIRFAIDSTFFNNPFASFKLASVSGKSLELEFERSGVLNEKNSRYRSMFEGQFSTYLKGIETQNGDGSYNTGINKISLQFEDDKCIVECDSDENARFIESIFREKNAVKQYSEDKKGANKENITPAKKKPVVSTQKLGYQASGSFYSDMSDILWNDGTKKNRSINNGSYK